VTRVLILARFFPPIGGAGVHRALGSVRHLPSHGITPVVVTGPVPRAPRNRWEPVDADLLARVPATAEVHRLHGPEPDRDLSRLGRLLARRPPLDRWWIDESARLGARVGGSVDVVLASCAPYDTALAAARVARELGVPWVADLDDPWALDEMRVPASALHRSLDVRRMRRALAGASAIVMSAPEAARRLRRAMPELASRATAIPIGYEPADFEAPVEPHDDGVFRILHLGSLHTDFGLHLRGTRLRRRLLGGGVPGLDVLTRSHVVVVEAIERLLRADPSLSGRVELHLAGEQTAADRAVSEGHPFVRELGLRSYDESTRLARAADLLFLPMHDLPEGMRAGLIPYKTYDYLGARRPILAAVPDGDVRDLLAPLPHATLVRPRDVEGMAAALRQRIAAGREPDAVPPPEYERARCVAALAEVLEGVYSAPAVSDPLVKEARR
jgi:glycosyltransferase involved in cell wall biosynthesis